MAIQIYRTDLTSDKPRELIAGYGSIGLHTALEFMERFACEEADARDDVSHISRISDKRDTRIVTRYTLVGNASHRPSLAEYTYRIVGG